MAEHDALPPAGRGGVHTLPGQVWRPGDSNKHLGPPEHLQIPLWSPLFSTRCGLTADAGPWLVSTDDDDVWCVGCLTQAAIGHELWEDD